MRLRASWLPRRGSRAEGVAAPLTLLIRAVLFALSFVSGMLGLGVAFVAIPVLAVFGFELKHEIMPRALLLNGLTAVSAGISFLRRKMVDLKTGVPLVILTTVAPPRRRLSDPVHRDDDDLVDFRRGPGLPRDPAGDAKRPGDGADVTDIAPGRLVLARVIGSVIGVFAGFLGVGPGVLLMPTLVTLGYTARIVAATNAVAATLPSFSAFAAHRTDASLAPALVASSAVTSIVGAQLGAAFMAKRVKSRITEVAFAAPLVLLALQRVYLLTR